jgi:methylphosphonate synthase
MNTGDSNYITPFVPHSYTSRDASREAYIVAVTFQGKLEHIQQELALLDPERVEQEMLDLSDRRQACGGLLRRELAISMMGLDQLSEGAEIAASRLDTLVRGEGFPTMQELTRISSGLGINVRDLLPPENIDPSQVVVRHGSSENCRHFPSEECPSYQVTDLAGSHQVPFAKGLAVRVLDTVSPSEEPSLDLVAPAHEFAYNYGDEAALLHWQGGDGVREAVIQPGGSYYMKPGVPHALRNLDPSRQSDIVIVRVGASFHGDAHLELSSIPREALNRVFSETRQWYDPGLQDA